MWIPSENDWFTWNFKLLPENQVKVEFRHTDPKRKSYNVVIFKFSNDDVIVDKPASCESKDTFLKTVQVERRTWDLLVLVYIILQTVP